MPIALAALACTATALSSAPVDVRFGEFFKTPVGPGGLEASPRLRELDGRRVRITGYMVRDDAAASRTFILSPLPIVLGHEDDDLADDLPPSAVAVRWPEAFASFDRPWRPGIVRVTGTLCAGTSRESDGRLSAIHLLLDERSAEALLQPAKESP